MNLGFDLDGVLHPWHEGVWKRLTHEGYITSTFDEYWDRGWLDMKENQNILFMNMVNDPLMYSSQAPYYGTIELLNSLKEDGHKLWYITQRPPHLEYTTKAWVRHWKFPFQDNLVRVDTSKRMVIIEKEIDLFVDDAVRHVEDLKNYTKVLLVKRPYNKEVQENFDTISSVLEIGKYINGKE